ncbi:MAG: alpha/beta hydrolase, partial [Cyanobacteria bacterium P01_G01_bin.19]
MHISWYHCLFLLTAIFHLAASIRERKSMPPPGKLIDVDGTKMHLYLKGKGDLTIVLDHSLGGIEGYFLIDELAKIARVCICDRPGYGWS